MENNSNTSSKGDGVLKADKNLCVGRNAATQTPEMPRHVMEGLTPKSEATTASSTTLSPSLPVSNLQPPSIVILRVNDNQSSTIETSDQEQKIFAIPDVVVEYIKDPDSIKDDESNMGEHNMAFDISDEYSKPSSRPSSRLENEGLQINTGDVQNNVIYLQPMNSNKLGDPPANGGISFLEVNDSNRIYYSLPRNYRKSFVENIKLHSQPSTPILKRTLNEAGYEMGSSASLCYFQTVESSPSSERASLNFNYKPMDGAAGVYTISGRRTVVSNRETAEALNQNVVHLLTPIILQPEQPSPKSIKKFEFSPMPPQIDRKRRKLQCFTDSLSLICFIPGLLLALFTPILIIPMFSMPHKLYIPLLGIFFAVGTLSAVIIAFAGILGNIVWHYDERKKRLRLRMHCGVGPTFHFWGNGLYYAAEEKKQKELIV